MGEKIGYARVSTREQNLSPQEDALSKAGCIRIFTDKISGKEFNREGLKACMDYLRSEDTLVIYRLDRLGRSVKEMLDLCAQLESRRIKLVSLQDNLDTSTAVGRFTMQILASLAEYHRNLILEGCKAGIEAAQKRGVKFGRQTGVKMKKPNLIFVPSSKAGASSWSPCRTISTHLRQSAGSPCRSCHPWPSITVT